MFPRLRRQADAFEHGFEFVSPGVSAGEFEIVLRFLILVENFFEFLAGDVGHLVFQIAQAMG